MPTTPRSAILQALVYPRQLMQGSIGLDQCTHAGYYEVGARDCEACDHEPECAWLAGHDDLVDLESKSVAALTEALEVCFSYVDARVTRQRHDTARCRCEACSWLRDAERLLEGLR